jgi:uncharacterized protein
MNERLLTVGAERSASASDVSSLQIARAVSPRFQELILLPTEKCNLRCTYCYEDFKIGRMSEATQRSLELYLDQRIPHLNGLRLSWFGGEPLMATDIVLRVSRYADALCDVHGVGFSGGLTTNAYNLDRRTFLDLLSCKQNFFQITLDGWQETHDEVRRFANGRGSFDRIWANLLDIATVEDDFEILLRIHVRRNNIDSLAVLIDRLAKEFGNDSRFRLDFEHVRDLGGEGGKSITDGVTYAELGPIEQVMRERFYKAVAALHAGQEGQLIKRHEADVLVAGAKGAGESAGSQRLADLQAGGPYICYASKPNSLLVRADGRIGKCTVALNDPRNDIGQLNADGTLAIDNPKLRPWVRGFEQLDEDALGCPLAGMPRALRNELEAISA